LYIDDDEDDTTYQDPNLGISDDVAMDNVNTLENACTPLYVGA
jgi:hypothetical protein